MIRNKRYNNIETQYTETNIAVQKQIVCKAENKMNEKICYNAKDIAAMLGISMSKAYKILREMNQELSLKGFLTIAGKIPVAYELLLVLQRTLAIVYISKRKFSTNLHRKL